MFLLKSEFQQIINRVHVNVNATSESSPGPDFGDFDYSNTVDKPPLIIENQLFQLLGKPY